MRQVGTRTFLVVCLLAALLVAGGASYYASSHPDGLEAVAARTGFLDSANESPTASSPHADYSTRGIDDERVSGGVAGIAGALLVLGIAGGLFRVLRRRGDSSAGAGPAGDESDVRTTSGV